MYSEPSISDSETGMKRPSGSNLAEPEPKKSNLSSSERELNEEEVRESFPIPDQVVGREGENITPIQNQTEVSPP